MLYLALAVATSIDAAAAGITLPLVPVAPWIALALIGAITAALLARAATLPAARSAKVGSATLEIVGGLVLIANRRTSSCEHL